MGNESRAGEGGTDVAALSAGAIAAVISISGEPGPYDLMNLAVGITLTTVIGAYVLEHADKSIRGFAIAAAMALASIPAVGFLFEVFWAEPLLRQQLLCWPFQRSCPRIPDNTPSNVHSSNLVMIWALTTGGLYVLQWWKSRSIQIAPGQV